jgi:hypothetical protein
MAKEESGTKGVVDTRAGPGIDASLDELAKGLATGTLSRGKAIRWMGGALLGAALASVPGVAWANDCRRLGRECRRDSQCCSGNCVRRGDDKVCGCPEGQTRCNDRCVNLDRNENHCGECFNPCEEGQECVGGGCEGGGCPDGTTLCGGNCVNCPPGQILNSSTCQCDSCPPSGCPACQCFSGTLNQSTCTCECPPDIAARCAANGTDEFRGCCPTAAGFACVPLGTVCSPV